MDEAAAAGPRGPETRPQPAPGESKLPQSRCVPAAATGALTLPNAAWRTDPRGPDDPSDLEAGKEETGPGTAQKAEPIAPS